jgi:RND family efflux transporter MFP subunit
MAERRTTPLISIWTAAGLGLLAAACSQGEASTAPPVVQKVQPVQVEVYRVEQRELAGVIRASGQAAFKSETLLSFGAPGVVETLTVDDGDRVHAGQVLATLRRTTVGADAAEAEIVRRTAQQNYDRVSKLHAAGAASQADLDSARLALERARETISIVAPATGVILNRAVERGQVVTQGQAILQLGEDRTGVIVRAQLSSVDVARVHTGDAARIEIAGRESRSGKVSQISSKMSAGMGSFEVEIRLDDASQVRSGEVAEVFISAATVDGAPAKSSIIIPAIALIDARADQGIVYIADEKGVARRRAVQTEGVTDQGVVVVAGLQPGEAVVTRGASMVRDGDPISVKQD